MCVCVCVKRTQCLHKETSKERADQLTQQPQCLYKTSQYRKSSSTEYSNIRGIFGTKSRSQVFQYSSHPYLNCVCVCVYACTCVTVCVRVYVCACAGLCGVHIMSVLPFSILAMDDFLTKLHSRRQVPLNGPVPVYVCVCVVVVVVVVV